MSILTVNLKPLYQRRIALFWLILLLCQLPMVLGPLLADKPLPADSRMFMGYLIISIFVGFLMAGLQKEILTKPFTFCLPGHRNIPRRLILWCTGMANTLLGLVFLWYPKLDTMDRLLAVIAAASLGMMMSLLSAWLVITARNSLVLVAFLPLIIWALVFMGLHKLVQAIIVTSPLFVIALGLFVCWFFVWRWKLRRDSVARQNCGRFELGLLDGWNRDKQQRYREVTAARRWHKRGKPLAGGEALAGFFRAKMNYYDCFSWGRMIWGELYMFLGRVLNTMLWRSLAGCIVFILFAGYWPRMLHGSSERSVLDLFYVFPVFGAIQWKMPAYCSLLLPAGRREKYYGTLAAALAMTLLATVLVLGAATLSGLLELVLPMFEHAGISLRYHGMSIELFYFCPLVMPIGFILGVLIPRSSVVMFILGPVVLIGFVMLNWAGALTAAGPMVITAALLLSWLSFVVVLRWHCMRRCLVGSGR